MPDFSTVVVTQQNQAVVLNTVTQVVQVNSSVPGSYDSVARLGLGLFNVKEYGAIGDGSTDDTAALDSAMSAAALAVGGNGGGSLIWLPPGRYKRTTTWNVSPRVGILGAGQLASQLLCAHNNDGIKMDGGVLDSAQSTWNSLRDFTVAVTTANRATNTGGGIVDEGCAYNFVENVYVEGFQYNVILDQTEHFTMRNCYLNRISTNTQACIWLVNGPARQVGAGVRYTNAITIQDTQIKGISGNGIGVKDDGGVNHVYLNCNFANGASGFIGANILGLTYLGNAHENYSTVDMRLTDTTVGGTFYGNVQGAILQGNTFSSAVPYNVRLLGVTGGSIVGNTFAGATTASILFGSDNVTGVRVANNGKLVTGTSKNGVGFLDGTTNRLRANDVGGQGACTYVASGLTAGTVTFTPATMGFPATEAGEFIFPFRRFYAVNADGTNGEYIAISATTSTTATATFASDKAANWVLWGADVPVTQQQTPRVSGDRGDNSITLAVYTDVPDQRFASALTQNRTVTLSITAARNGDTFRIIRTGLGNFTLDVGGLKTIPALTAAVVTVKYNGTTWVLAGYELL